MQCLATMPSMQVGVGEDVEVIELPRPERRRGTRFGEYEIVTPLATGGMGGVYLAIEVATGRHVALKVLDPSLVKYPEVVARLDAEADIAQRANHPNVVRIHAARRSADGVPYLVMEYLDGDSLANVIDVDGLDIASITAVGAQVAAALAALHAAGVIHCDVKPDNVLVLRDGDGPRVKLLDFGVSRLVDEPRGEVQIAGTPWCMAPEQWRGLPVPASDVYALGCLLFNLLTGDMPFDGSLPELMLAHLEQRPARPSWLRAGVPAALDRLVLRALAKEVALRPSMDEVAHELAALADDMVGQLKLAG
jgi:serine/threonine protein kinase